MTLMSLFRYPGVFAAGIARASVTDWAHYSDGWTSRILGVPHEAPEAYRVSSPIYYAEGLADPLLITHGLVDDNVHFQNTVQMVDALQKANKQFDMMMYPGRNHGIFGGSTRLNLFKKAKNGERYSFIFDGNSQMLDHIFVSKKAKSGAKFDVVHVNDVFMRDCCDGLSLA